MSATHRVVFTPSGLGGEIGHETTVLAAARSLGVDLDSVCGGRGVCGRCQVNPAFGHHAKWGVEAAPGALTPPGSTEAGYRGRRPLAEGHRLGCAARVVGDVVIDVPAESQVHRQVVRKDLDLGVVEVDPRFRLLYLETPGARGPDRIRAALADEHGLEVAGIGDAARAALGDVDGPCTVVLAGTPASVVAAWPGLVDRIHGVAIDIGSTTVAGHLCELTSGAVLASAGRMNPQIRFGEDLMSRVSYVMMNPGGDRELTDAIRTALDQLVGDLLDGTDADRRSVLDVVLVGNPVMHHIALGLDPTPLGTAPFPLATEGSVDTRAADLDLDLPFARVYAAPCIAGHVGADTAAAMLAEGPHRGTEPQLLVDVGTNAEIVLGDRSQLLAASSPTGPAFEGAQISGGQRATAGAIERVRIDPHTLEPRLKVIGAEGWSDEPGFADQVATTGITGICGSGIIEAVAEMYLSGLLDADGTIVADMAERTHRVVADGRTFAYLLHHDDGGDIAVTQNDVRAIQLAKAALRAGIDLLLERAGGPEVHDIRLAGAFGTHLSPLHALVLGLVPDCPLDGVRSVGNAAGAGAVQALLSTDARAQLERAVTRVDKVETATEPRFQELFVAAMAIPHATAPTRHLAEHVTLPQPMAAPTSRRRRRARPQENPT